MGRKTIDITGRRFGRLVAIRQVKREETDVVFSTTNAYWLCQCDCGKEAIVSSYNLRSEITKSCGCLRNEVFQNSIDVKKLIDLTGQRFGRLVVIKRIMPGEVPGKIRNDKVYWLCKCDCGNETVVTSQNLRSGNTKSCGCNRKNSGRRKSTQKGE